VTAMRKKISKPASESDTGDVCFQDKDSTVFLPTTAPMEDGELTSDPRSRFPIVGIGASAGGLSAFEAFFSGMPVDRDPGMAFVLVQHLAPDHKSILTEIIRRFTRMEVFEVEDGILVKPNCTYIIPPNRDMAFLNGTLQLLEPTVPHGHRLPIDFFFRSLAQDQHERAICIVLSGTGSDGSMGVRAVKAEGGMAMVQNPASTEYDGMPRSAIRTGLVDFELPPAEMPAQLLAYAEHAFVKAAAPAVATSPKTENLLKKIFVLLRAQTGHDFSQYKQSTIRRRIERRMAVQQIDGMDGYVQYLQQAPKEVEALFRDMLIGVTSFFRDPEAFKALEEQVIPKLFAGKVPGSSIRIWCTGCSTGEEAYSLAILLQERLDVLRQKYKVQVFATDIDSQSIAVARMGRYPANISSDLSQERLERFFTLEPGGESYRIQKYIRDLLVFSEQDLIRDPPFSKIDLISCRNLMIYLNGDVQKKLIPMFHYALNPGGMLFLGTSETVGEHDLLFSANDRIRKIYSRREDVVETRHPWPVRPIMSTPLLEVTHELPSGKGGSAARVSLRERTEQTLLKHFSSTAALVTVKGDILYLHGRTGMYLEPAPGEVDTSNILKMARDGLLYPLAAALRKAVELNETVHSGNLLVRTNGHHTLVNLTVIPLDAEPEVKESPLFLVVMEEAAISEVAHQQADTLRDASVPLGIPPEAPVSKTDADIQITILKRKLREKDEYLQTAKEELETSVEELKSSNEEMQSVNEELQSANEELETAKEELQSVNEELSTVNGELQDKVADLSRTNNDISNLLAGTGIGSIFVDYQLRIMRFTPAAAQIINLIPSDLGRPVAHIVSNLAGYDRMVVDVRSVLDTLIPKSMEVQTYEGIWYMMKILPYRTIDNVIEGAVITFLDITESVQTRESLRISNELSRLAVVVRDSNDAITVQDLSGQILAWNPSATRMYGWSESEALKMNVRDRIPKSMLQGEITVIHRLAQSNAIEP